MKAPLNRVQIANRALWGLVALTLVAAGAGLGLEQVRLHAAVEPLPVPRPVLAPMPKAGALADAAQRNPFDPSGAPWRLAEAKAAAVAQKSEVLGVVMLPGRRGVMTAGGFVAVGEDFGGGKLKQVQSHVIVVALGAEERRIELGGKELELLRKLGLDGSRPAFQGSEQQ